MVLDTDIMIDMLRKFPPAMAWGQELEDAEVVLPGYVMMELIQGCHNKQERNRLQKFVEDYSIVWPSPGYCNQALEIFSEYHLSHSIGLLDALIGLSAVAVNLPLYTFNQKHYSMIPNLHSIQPYEK